MATGRFEPFPRTSLFTAGVAERARRVGPSFPRFAWALLAFTVYVILGGTLVRATGSGDGCTNHWPDCNGQLLPAFGQLKTIIEFSHRASTGLLTVAILALVAWAFAQYPRRHPARLGAVLTLPLLFAEVIIGAALVHYRLVAYNASPARAVVISLHLATQFMLLMAIALSAWWGSGGARIRLRGQGPLGWALGGGLLLTLLLGVSGAITALGDTLFPAASLKQGFEQDFAPSAHFLIGLRIYHPLIAMIAGLYLLLIAGLATNLRPAPNVRRAARALVALFLLQMGAGALNLGLLAPIWMQLIHLLLADLLWITLVILAAASLGEGVPHVELAAAEQDAPPATRATWRDYLALTKPRVISLLLLTTLAAMYVGARATPGPGPGLLAYFAVALGLYMAAGAANAINMVLERDLDLRMGRTARRPTVTATIPARLALRFAFVLAAGSFALIWAASNMLAAMLAFAGLAFYVVVYTLLLKRRTWANIVIGGAAGAFPPLVGWAAATGDLSPLAWCLFGIIFLWTPVHFWALAILLKDEYARAGVPMLPVVRGERATVIQIAGYALLTVAISAAPVVLRAANGQAALGGLYLGAAVLLNAVLLGLSARLYRRPDPPGARALFHYSMVYLALLFLAMAVDRAAA